MGRVATTTPLGESPSLSPSEFQLPSKACGNGGNVFVTVGTTSFDALVKAVDTEEFRDILRSRGYNSLTMQIGRGRYIPSCGCGDDSSSEKEGESISYSCKEEEEEEEEEEESNTERNSKKTRKQSEDNNSRFASSSTSSLSGEASTFSVRGFRFRPSLAADMQSAALVISHAGSGSIFEALKYMRPLVVVVNEDLMDNHQKELASELASRKHLFYASCSNLADVMRTVDLSSLVEYPAGDPDRFVKSIGEFLGFPPSL
ncbi:hypothetical protein CBR_g24390 [Chara braunii]|uniref:Glycosyl transferase family 28 C-terminal domain-containing protein n=1 Tax=Chara braunii TaxID=69332 RepID=A0A388JML4_CHABU|nr:hypothetical protein CBR_g24390 [Chara braunii]|eukprot:GBG59044.1 hypothetical protein CBR_g24390 [Chara braunii]